jgi:DNA-binding NarL/FixJ family response regulator
VPASTKPLRVVLAEDNVFVREGLVSVLSTHERIAVAAVCESLDELLAAVREEPPDVVVTDVRMPPTHSDEGIRAARELRASHPDVGVVVLSQYVEPRYALALFETTTNGRGYLLKENTGDVARLVLALDTVAAGGSFIDPAVVDTMIAARQGAASSPIGRLSPREREVLAEAAAGRSNAAIAAALYVSERAVEKHINSIFAKLGLTEDPHTHRRVRAVLLYLSGGSTLAGDEDGR